MRIRKIDESEDKKEIIETKVMSAAYNILNHGAGKRSSFMNGVKWAVHNLTQEEIEYIKQNTDKDDLSIFGLKIF